MKAEKWIGLVKVEPVVPAILGNAAGAYTNAIGFASDRKEFRKAIKEKLAEMG